MKNIFAFLLYCVSLTIIACDSSEVDTPDNWFRDPVVAVTGTTVEVKCLTLFGDGVLASASTCGFVCTPLSGDAQTPPLRMADPEIEGSMMKARLVLEPETDYEIQAYVSFGSDRMTSRTVAFATGPASETPDPTPDPEPDPDPQPGSYPGWPELPKQALTEVPTHYVAKHICPDFTYNGVAVSGLRSYTVCYNASTRTAMWSAYPLHACYKGDQSRSDAWAYDPDISQSLQPVITGGNYKIPGVTPPISYSRGHLIASSDRTASLEINKQTFYVTNAAPQWQNGFNGGVWQKLEEKCWDNICADTLFVVTGVHFANESTTVVDNATPPNTVVVPTNFYKVMIRSKAGNTGKPLYRLEADELQCIAFWFGNESYTGQSYANFKTTVADVEQKTGMTFFSNVPNATAEVKASNAGTWSF